MHSATGASGHGQLQWAGCTCAGLPCFRPTPETAVCTPQPLAPAEESIARFIKRGQQRKSE